MHAFTLKRCSVALSAAALLGLGMGAQAAPAGTGPGAPVAAPVTTTVTTVTTTVTNEAQAPRFERGQRGHAKGQSARCGRDFRHGGMHMKRGGMGRADDAMWVPGYGPVSQEVVDSLALTTEQQALLTQAREAGFGKMARGERPGERMRSADGAVDPHAALERRAEWREQQQARRDEHQKLWLAVWDALDDGQKETLSTYFNTRAAQWRGARDGMGQGRDWRGHRHHDRGQGYGQGRPFQRSGQ